MTVGQLGNQFRPDSASSAVNCLRLGEAYDIAEMRCRSESSHIRREAAISVITTQTHSINNACRVKYTLIFRREPG